MKHHWLDWNDMAEDHVRSFTDSDSGRRWAKPQAVHKIINTQSQNAHSGVEYRYVVEFQEPLAPGSYPNGRMAQSFAPWVFPNLHFPRWHRAGGSMVIVRNSGTLRWLNENLATPLLGIRTSKLLYVTTDDPDDFVLIKLRCEEYTI